MATELNFITSSKHNVSNNKQQQVAPAEKKKTRCISLVVTEDTWVVVTSEQGYQAESENGLQFSLRVDMPGSLAQRCRAFV
jgi:uracil DNA glycosylase